MNRQLSAALVIAVLSTNASSQPLSETFTYQGVLLDEFGVPYSGACELEFTLFDAPIGGNEVGPTVSACFDGLGGNPASIQDGLIGVELDFGTGHFDGRSLWLEIAVACPCGDELDAFETLVPRQRMTPVPYAINANRLGGLSPAAFLQNAAGVVTGENLANDAAALTRVSGSAMHSTGTRIGIGTQSPGRELDVIGDIRASGDLLGDTVRADDANFEGSVSVDDNLDAETLFVDDVVIGGGGGVDARLTIRQSGNPDLLRFFDNGTDVFRVRDAGRTRIGASSPTTPNGMFEVWNSAGAADVFAVFGSSNQEILTVRNTGLVGIGVTSPIYNLHVAGTIVATSEVGTEDLTVDRARFGGAGFDGSMSVRQSGSGDIFNLYDGSTNVVTVVNGGQVGIGTSDPQSRLHVVGAGADPFPNASHVAVFESTGGGSPDGIAIKLSESSPDSNNNFVTFYDANESVRGRIEGNDLFDIAALLQEVDLGDLVTGGNQACACMCGDIFGVCNPLGCSIPNTVAELEQLFNCVPGVHQTLASILVEYGLAGLADPGPGDLLNVWANLVAKQNGVIYGSRGADYAEWLPKRSAEEVFGPGDIIGVQSGKVSRSTTHAEQVMVVSVAPVVVGNIPPCGDEEKHVRVAFMGQVPVWVNGRVDAGDFIVPSGDDDGRGLAVAPDELRAHHLGTIVGRAWSSSTGPGLGLVNVLVGVATNETEIVVQNQAARMRHLESEVRGLSTQVAQVGEFEQRLAALELRLAEQVVSRPHASWQGE